MSSASLDEVWGHESFEEPAVAQVDEQTLSARVQKIDAATNDVPHIDVERVRMEIMERMSTFLIVVMGALTVLLVHIERLRREVRLLREGILRPL